MARRRLNYVLVDINLAREDFISLGRAGKDFLDQAIIEAPKLESEDPWYNAAFNDGRKSLARELREMTFPLEKKEAIKNVKE